MKILLVVDMQNDFIHGKLGTEEAKKIVPSVLKRIHEHKDVIIVTLDTHGEDYLSTEEGKHLPVEHCIKGSEGWKLHHDVERALQDKEVIYLEKPVFGAASLQEVYEQLQTSKGPIEEVELIGLCTDICVISNAILTKTFLPQVPIVVNGNLCAGVSPESHRNALNAMKVCQISII